MDSFNPIGACFIMIIPYKSRVLQHDYFLKLHLILSSYIKYVNPYLLKFFLYN
jgi:hypothetical protein